MSMNQLTRSTRKSEDTLLSSTIQHSFNSCPLYYVLNRKTTKRILLFIRSRTVVECIFEKELCPRLSSSDNRRRNNNNKNNKNNNNYITARFYIYVKLMNRKNEEKIEEEEEEEQERRHTRDLQSKSTSSFNYI